MGRFLFFPHRGERHHHVIEYVEWAKKVWLVFAALSRGWNSSLMMLQRTRMGEFITNDPGYVPNIHRPRTRALSER
jgi:hypothetical protein